MADPTNCDRCRDNLEGGWSERRNHKTGEVTSVLCFLCARQDAMDDYRRTGEITSRLGGDAAVANLYLSGECSSGSLRDGVYQFWLRNADSLREIAAANEEIAAAASQFECAHWLPHIQAYYNKATTRGHNGDGGDFVTLLWGSAGRVLLTIKDKYPVGHPDGKYGGAWVTLIFDESSKETRGGVQGMCATKQEALALIAAATERMPSLLPDCQVTLAGL